MLEQLHNADPPSKTCHNQHSQRTFQQAFINSGSCAPDILREAHLALTRDIAFCFINLSRLWNRCKPGCRDTLCPWHEICFDVPQQRHTRYCLRKEAYWGLRQNNENDSTCGELPNSFPGKICERISDEAARTFNSNPHPVASKSCYMHTYMYSCGATLYTDTTMPTVMTATTTRHQQQQGRSVAQRGLTSTLGQRKGRSVTWSANVYRQGTPIQHALQSVTPVV